ncbi:MAG TPA: hypothetical protein VF546_19190 [Pyrinomonadaceae bacterium]
MIGEAPSERARPLGEVKNLLHGTWLGHPLPPVLTDWSETHGRGRKFGLVHGLLNVGATALHATSLVEGQIEVKSVDG